MASVLSSVRGIDFMASLDLEDVYFQISIHQASRKYLLSALDCVLYQFKLLCFRILIVFIWMFMLVLALTHSRSIHLCYLNGWLVVAQTLFCLVHHIEYISFSSYASLWVL